MITEQEKQVIAALEALGFTSNVMLLLEERIKSEEEDENISMLHPYLPLLKALITMIPVSHVAITLCNDEEKLNTIIAHIDGPSNTQLQIMAAQGYKKAIGILRENESLLKQMKQAPTLTSILNTLNGNINLIRHYISLGFTPESMGLILFIQRSQLKVTFRILEENISLFQDKLKKFPEDILTQRLLEQHSKIETFAMRVELLKTERLFPGEASQSLTLSSPDARVILQPQAPGQLPNAGSRMNAYPGSGLSKQLG